MMLAGTLTLGSCADDFLDQTNSYQIAQGNFFSSDEAVAQEVYPLYSYVWYMYQLHRDGCLRRSDRCMAFFLRGGGSGQ